MSAPEQIRRLFDEAVELRPEDRKAYLDRACGNDLELRRELESLLAASADARTGELLPPLSLTAGDTAEPTLIGQRVQNWELVSIIGEGGMGTVYLARHQYFPRQAAIKVLHAHLCRDRGVVQRFLNEARAAHAIKHPNIIEIQDAGLLASGAPYLLLEYLVGENLRARLEREGKLPAAEALQIVGQASSALAAAHDGGIVHRDLKPENLFVVRRSDGQPRVKVLDFGIAKLRADIMGMNLHDVRTQTGVVLGTPRYMSPEQCRGGRDIDHRTDIYSLGVILYELLCGRPPFVSAGVADVIFMHVGLAPPPPTQWNPAIPAAIERAILKALAKQPEDRFGSVREFRAALGPSAVPLAEPRATVEGTREGDSLTPVAGGSGARVAVNGSGSRWAALLLTAAGVASVGVYGLERQRNRPRVEAAQDRAAAPPPAFLPARPAIVPAAADAAAAQVDGPRPDAAPAVKKRKPKQQPSDSEWKPQRW
jgi:tRNA A-37 threonylcarbamoyl transferase component Bud32